MATVENQRRILVIEPRLQFRYLILPLVVTLTTSACLFTLFVMQAHTLRGFVKPDNDFLLGQIERMQIMTAVVVGCVLLGHVGCVLWLGLLASHRVAGPIYRFKKAMREVGAGNLNLRVHLRRKDQLKDVAASFNEMVSRLKAHDDRLREQLGDAYPEDVVEEKVPEDPPSPAPGSDAPPS
jgi:methyl-accepting chemotaxis protein